MQAGYQDWVNSKVTQKQFRDAPRKKLPALLKGQEKPATFLWISSELGYLALWADKFGAISVLNGDPAGWGHLRLSLNFREWMLRIRRYEYARALVEGRSFSATLFHGDLARCFALAVALKHDALADWCGQLVLNELRAPTGLMRMWDLTPFHPLMAWLYATWRKQRIPPNKQRWRDLGVYQPLVDGWKDDNAFRTAITQACDYHCARSDVNVDEMSEFWHPPIDVLPAEILAAMRIRRELLGSELAVTHPLLTSPLASVPDRIPRRTEPLLRGVARRVRRVEKRLLGKQSASHAGKT